MEVMDTPFRAGDLRHGYQAVADNLPNDPRIHQEKGTKKIFFKNFMDARVNYVVLPIGKQLMREDQAALASMEGYLAVVLMHEICHGLGPAYARTAAGKADIRESIGPTYAGLEEAKADIVGLFALNWLMDKGVIQKNAGQHVLCVARRRNFPYGALWRGGSPRSGRDDGIQLPGRARRHHLRSQDLKVCN